MRDLARNPMQLAILLSLVLTRGASLPDKRTALYEYYIDLFFSRESEKSAVVRDHRELLINIHRFLGWLLHSEAELGNARASISQSKLLQVVTAYLAREGHNTRLADDLFAGMVERVVALVSRVEGTFEFEVQPLREYFAACHLYYTAPQSSPGKEKPGSKPDRFDAIARNFYWLNVTRFYAGCYSKGELPSLVERLEELAFEDGFRNIAHPRMLAATLLADWVFAQNPKSVQELVQLLFDRVGLTYFASDTNARRRDLGTPGDLVLPPKCGRDEVTERAYSLLEQRPASDIQEGLIRLLGSNAESVSDLVGGWLDVYRKQTTEADRTRWLEYGRRLGILSGFDLDTLDKLVGSPTDATASILFQARRLDYVEHSEAQFERTASVILDRDVTAVDRTAVTSALDALTICIDPSRYSIAFRYRQPLPLDLIFERYEWVRDLSWHVAPGSRVESYESYSKCVELARASMEGTKRTGAEWATSLEPWDHIVEIGRSCWGDRWAFFELANVASGIHSTSERCSDFSRLLDHGRSLSRRVRYARLRSGNSTWWTKQFGTATNVHDSMMMMLIASTWMTLNTLLTTVESLEEALEAISPAQWRQLFYSVRWAGYITTVREDKNESFNLNRFPSKLSERMASIFALRAQETGDEAFFEKYFESSDFDDFVALEFVMRDALDLPRLGTSSWNPDLESIQKCYKLGRAHGPALLHSRLREAKIVSVDLAKKIMEEANKYPGFLVMMAEGRCREDVASKILPVVRVADREKWFESA
jgi:hypothetical protein